ncbi:NAD(P)-binding protein [Polychaeton citri CBS 116435]|uniref:NAD(P)-binding protein n=1 Tax=Polychaeton citri CBS 116435 TaxID=1314669 RepID=A0A9P4Q993_9PEZI|nr:NAD(P)-binding protein [Polychaeton citri CBS 116435]
MASTFFNVLYQCYFIPKPTLTESNLPDQTGRVFIVTGGYAGVGKELCKILYGKNGTVYIAGRSKQKADSAVDEIRQAHPSSDGRLEFLQVDLSDLPTIKASSDDFLRREQRLDVLTNNAGVMMPPKGSTTPQGHELQMGTNCLGPYLLTKYLTPLLHKTAAASPPGSVRVTWAASLGTMGAPKEGVAWEDRVVGGGDGIEAAKTLGNPGNDYAQTKACNVLLAREFQARNGPSGVVSNAWNPGNLRSELTRHQSLIGAWLIGTFLAYPPIYGAYTELWAGWSEEAGQPENVNKYIGPWGRFIDLRGDIEKSTQTKKFWDWCEQETSKYATQ